VIKSFFRTIKKEKECTLYYAINRFAPTSRKNGKRFDIFKELLKTLEKNKQITRRGCFSNFKQNTSQTHKEEL
jgi:hypothetical protein